MKRGRERGEERQTKTINEKNILNNREKREKNTFENCEEDILKISSTYPVRNLYIFQFLEVKEERTQTQKHYVEE